MWRYPNSAGGEAGLWAAVGGVAKPKAKTVRRKILTKATDKRQKNWLKTDILITYK
jgi:hypothetical protein